MNPDYERANELKEQGMKALEANQINKAEEIFTQAISIYSFDQLYLFRGLTRLAKLENQDNYLVSDATYTMDDFIVYTIFQWIGYLRASEDESAESFYDYISNWLVSLNECLMIVNPQGLVAQDTNTSEALRRDILNRNGFRVDTNSQVIETLPITSVGFMLDYINKLMSTDYEQYMNSGIRDDVKMVYQNIPKFHQLFSDFSKFVINNIN